jgi:large subunit ribosomal protein L21
MYAVVDFSGFQYLVKEGEIVTVPRLKLEPGTELRLDKVLMVRKDDKVLLGRPSVESAYVEAKVVDHPRADKVQTFKFIRRENYRRKQGHRQPLTRIAISRIHVG